MIGIDNHTVMRLLFLLCLGRALGVVRNNVVDEDGIFGLKNYRIVSKHGSSEADDSMIRRIEEEMLSLNKSGDSLRDKRALGIFLQGVMEALGYTVSPVQIAFLPNNNTNSTPAMQMPAAGAAPMPMPPPPPGMMFMRPKSPMSMPMPPMGKPQMPPMMPNASSAPAQRETLRFTGVLNFGNGLNTTNVLSSLTQYEQIFHGNSTAAPAASAPAPAPPKTPPPPPGRDIDPRSPPQNQEPLFLKIPLPIAENFPPPHVPSSAFVQDAFGNGYDKEHSEEYMGIENDEDNNYHHNDFTNIKNGEDDKYHHNDFTSMKNDEDDGYHYNNEHGNNREEYDEPKDRNYQYKGSEGSYDKPPLEPPVSHEKNTEKEYKKSEKIENYSVENKEIHDPSEVSDEVPTVGSQFNHAMYVGEPNWKQEQTASIYKIAAEQEAQAEALAEEKTEKEKERSHERESGEDDRSHSSKEKEISNRNEEPSDGDVSNENPYYNEEEEDHYSREKESDYQSTDEGNQTEINQIPDKLTSDSHNEPTTTELPAKNQKVPEKPATGIYQDHQYYSDERPPEYHNNYNYDKERERGRYHASLPITEDGDKSRPDQTLRDSYGESLEKPGSRTGERVSGYFTMFKNPQTGVYDPSIIQHYENSRGAYDQIDLAEGFKKIQKEYGSPESKYEEYEMNYDDDDKVEHRAADQEQEKDENESNTSTEKTRSNEKPSKPTECDCGTRTPEVRLYAEESPAKPATTGSPIPKTPGVSYGPYYSTIRYIYEPLDYDQGLIARLTSYAPPALTKFENKAGFTHDPMGTSVQRPLTIAPTQVPISEKLIAKSLLQQPETKEIRAWPAPFDYVFDNTDHNDVVLKRTPQTRMKDAINKQPISRQTLFEPTKADCYQETNPPPPAEFVKRVQNLMKEHKNNKLSVGNNNRAQGQPRNSLEGRRIKQHRQQKNKVK